MTQVLTRGSGVPVLQGESALQRELALQREVEVRRRRRSRRASAANAAILACGGLGLLVIVGGPVSSLVSLFVS